MPIWTLIGLMKGKATTDWPAKHGDTGQENVLGMPRYRPNACQDNCNRCVEACFPKAITRPDPTQPLYVDYGKCINCQLCTEVCPTNALTPSEDWAFGVTKRDDLIWSQNANTQIIKDPEKKGFKHSLHIRHVDAGSCNGCESELEAMTNPFYDLERLGIFFTASPRHADLLLVTGPVTNAMHGPLLAAYEAMPKPCWVMAVGTCAVSGAGLGGNNHCHHGLEGILPVDVYLPGCPPNPTAILSALLMFLERMSQKVQGGQIQDAVL